MDWKTIVHDRQEDLLSILAALVKEATVSPPGRNADACQDYICDFMKELGAVIDRWTFYPGDDLVVAELKGRDPKAPTLILNGHVDVATLGDPSEWTCPPFALTRRGDRVFGRGVADMKGAVACALFALRLLKEKDSLPPGTVQLQSVIGEEAGEAGTRDVLERGHTGDFAICMDTSDMRIEGQGGCVTGWITVRSKDVFHDAVRHRMVHPNADVEGASAIEKMQKVLSALREMEDRWYHEKSYPGFARGVNTINPAVIEGGRNAAFVADVCSLWITVHFYPNEDYREVIRELEDHLKESLGDDPWFARNSLEFKWGGKSMIEERGEIFPSCEVDDQLPAVQQLIAIHEAVTGTPAIRSMNPSVTDAGWLASAGIPSVLYGPGETKEAHSVDESVRLEQLLDFSEVLCRFISSYGC